MKTLLLLSILTLPLCIFAQGPNTNINPQQAKNINYYVQLVNDDNISNQQANPLAPQQQGGGLGTLFGSNNTNETPCTDCDKVKRAIRQSHATSGGSQQKRSFNGKKWSRTLAGKMNMKMKKAFARKYRARTNYAICFNWS